jgi:hypothetical protein
LHFAFEPTETFFEKFDYEGKLPVCFGLIFLIKIQKNSLTGQWAKEVVKHLFKGENGNVK